MKALEINAVIKIDRKVFEYIYQQYYNPLCAFAYRFISDVDFVEDLVQEVYVYLWEKKDGFDNLNAVKSFLYTSVRNRCLNLIKHRDVQQKNEKDIIMSLEDNEDFQKYVIEEEVFSGLYNEIKLLPESARNIMLLALNGLKNPEIAEELNVSVNTVKTQKKIAYSKLKSKLKPSEYLLLLTF